MLTNPTSMRVTTITTRQSDQGRERGEEGEGACEEGRGGGRRAPWRTTWTRNPSRDIARGGMELWWGGMGSENRERLTSNIAKKRLPTHYKEHILIP